MITRRSFSAALLGAGAARAADEPADADPFGSLQWPQLRHELFGAAPVAFDTRVQVRAPAFAEDAMNVPVAVDASALAGVQAALVFVDRNPIRRVLEVVPLGASPAISFRLKLEQASPVRAAARTADGRWHVGGTQVDASGGGCTVAGTTRRDGSWSRTLGRVGARLFPSSDGAGPTRLRLMVMHPMDTGLVGGIPAFHLSRLALRDANGRELLRLAIFEPVSENPVFGFDFVQPPPRPLRLVGADNNGNRIDTSIE